MFVYGKRIGMTQGWSRIHYMDRTVHYTVHIWTPLGGLLIEVRDSRTGYLLPARDGPGALPDGQSCWDAAVAAVSCQNVTLISFSFRA